MYVCVCVSIGDDGSGAKDRRERWSTAGGNIYII